MTPSSPARTVSPRVRPARASAPTLAIALAGVSLAGCTAWPDADAYEEASRASLELAPQQRVIVENARGSVNLFVAEGGAVGLEARKRVIARSKERAREIASQIRVDVIREDDALRFVVDYPGDLPESRVTIEFFGFRTLVSRADVDLDLTLPAGTPVEVVTRSGDVFAEDFVGDLGIESASGDLLVRGHRGEVRFASRSGDARVGHLEGSFSMRTASGDLVARRVQGHFRFEATSGDVEADEIGGDVVIDIGSGDATLGRVAGSLDVRTTSGDIEARRIEGDVVATAASGDVTVALSRPSRAVFVRTSSGDVRVRLVEPLSGRLDVSTSSGEVHANLEMALEEYGRRGLRAVLGPGEGKVDVRTASGDVHLSAAAPRALNGSKG